MNPDKPLTQRDFIERLKDDLEMPIWTATVHRMIAQGMPVIRIGAKPRFHYPTCRAWILSSRELETAHPANLRYTKDRRTPIQRFVISRS